MPDELDLEEEWPHLRARPEPKMSDEAAFAKAQQVIKFLQDQGFPEGADMEERALKLMEMPDAALAIFINPDRFPREQVSDGGLILEGLEKEWVGPTVLPADDPEREPLGWTIREMTPEDLAERDSPENLAQLAEEREAISPEVAGFRTTHAAPYPPEPPEGHEGMYAWPRAQGSTTLIVLPELTGRPWNNATANFLMCLRPSAVRVTYGEVTLDSYDWRVTVYLNEDDTIREVTQEVSVGLVGFRNGQDASFYLARRDRLLDQPQPNMFVNPRGVRRLRLPSRQDMLARELLVGDIVLLNEGRYLVHTVTPIEDQGRVEFVDHEGRLHSFPLDETLQVIRNS